MADQVIGDLKRQTLMEIWQDPRFDVFSCREDRGDHCAVCDFRAYCGGCRPRAVSYLDDGELTTRNTGRLVQDMLTTISDSLDGSGV